MKTTSKPVIITTAAIVALFASSNATAQRGKGAADRRYDPKTVETIQGTVLSVEKTAPPQNRGYGVHLTLQTADNQTVDVHLGPAWFLDKQPTHVEAKDQITVTGSRVMIDGKPAIIAAEIKKGAVVLKLRDSNGIPIWAGAGRRNS